MAPQPPARIEIPRPDVAELVGRVRGALAALPVHFESQTHIEGIDATDLFGLNAILGSTIELQVVETLNRLRHIWDPVGAWSRHRFLRSAQSFPDVRLIAHEDGGRVVTVLGIELKGWYLLSKEGEPSFRYAVTPSACAPQDLLVVVPWRLKNVLSGRPVVHRPYMDQARYVAEYRNWWWTHERRTGDSNEWRQIAPPNPSPGHHPAPGAKTLDVPRKDGGGNFGRVARIDRLMKDYVQSLLREPVAGIPANHWRAFFRLHSEFRDSADIVNDLEKRLARHSHGAAAVEEIVQAILHIVRQFEK